MNEPEVIQRMLTEAKTVAIEGVSTSHRVASFLQSKGYRTVPVNPTVQGEILGGKVCIPASKAFRDPSTGWMSSAALRTCPEW